MNKNHRPFEVEKLRDRLASDGKIGDLKKTYTGKYPEIKDLNTPLFWDNLSVQNHVIFKENPMTFDKLRYISSNIKSGKVLNVGCGWGDLEDWVFNKLKRKDVVWTGMDFSKKNIVRCRHEFPNARFLLGDVYKLKKVGGGFDTIVVSEVMEHIKPKYVLHFLSKLRMLLAGNGIIIVSVPLNEGLEVMINNGLNPNAHVRDYTSNVLKAELRMSGFIVQDEKLFYAFKSLYYLKTFVVKYLLQGFRKYNNIAVVAGLK